MKTIAIAFAVSVGSLILGISTASASEGALDTIPSPFSLSQCAANTVCTWTDYNYLGTVTLFSGSGTKYPTKVVKSVANKHSGIVRVYNSSGSASICIAPGATKASMTTSYQNPAKIVLSSTKSC